VCACVRTGSAEFVIETVYHYRGRYITVYTRERGGVLFIYFFF